MTMHSRLKLGGSLKVALIKKGLRPRPYVPAGEKLGV